MKTLAGIVIIMLSLSACGLFEKKSKLDRPINKIENNCTRAQAQKGQCVRR